MPQRWFKVFASTSEDHKLKSPWLPQPSVAKKTAREQKWLCCLLSIPAKLAKRVHLWFDACWRRDIALTSEYYTALWGCSWLTSCVTEEARVRLHPPWFKAVIWSGRARGNWWMEIRRTIRKAFFFFFKVFLHFRAFYPENIQMK